MPVFRVTKSSFEALPETTFADQGIKERADIQRLLRANVAVVAPDVLIIAEEFADWEDSKRRIDLLGVDRTGNLVVIELKREDDGSHMDLQAVRYAAMISKMTFERAVNVFQRYLDRIIPGADARAKLLEFLDWKEPREDDFANDVRIVLVAANFSKELTTSALWLNERGLDIRCIRIRPHLLGSEVVVEVQVVIPLPETEEYTTGVRKKEQAVRVERAEQQGLRMSFWKELLAKAIDATPRFANISPGDDNWLGASAGVPGMRYVYIAWLESAAVELYIDRGDESFNKGAFDALVKQRGPIEAAYGRSLVWDRIKGKRAARIRDDSITGGVKSPRDKWQAIEATMIDSMRRLERALGPHLPAAAITADTETE